MGNRGNLDRTGGQHRIGSCIFKIADMQPHISQIFVTAQHDLHTFGFPSGKSDLCRAADFTQIGQIFAVNFLHTIDPTVSPDFTGGEFLLEFPDRLVIEIGDQTGFGTFVFGSDFLEIQQKIFQCLAALLHGSKAFFKGIKLFLHVAFLPE